MTVGGRIRRYEAKRSDIYTIPVATPVDEIAVPPEACVSTCGLDGAAQTNLNLIRSEHTVHPR
jgi:hypothetical protein